MVRVRLAYLKRTLSRFLLRHIVVLGLNEELLEVVSLVGLDIIRVLFSFQRGNDKSVIYTIKLGLRFDDARQR